MSCNFIFPQRGFVHVASSYQAGLYQVEGIQLPRVLITGMPLEDSDIILRQQTINGNRILYSMGPAFGEIAITGELLLGPAGESKGEILDALIRWFEANRVSAKKGPISISAGQTGYKFFMYRLALGQADPEFNTQTFILQGALAKPASK